MAHIQERPTRVVRTLAPGQPGTLKLLRLHGPNLVCVRYRIDPMAGRRYTTVELLADTGPMRSMARMADKRYAVRTRPDEKYLRAALQALGARWDATHRHWLTTGRVVRTLELQDRAQALSTNRAHPALARKTQA